MISKYETQAINFAKKNNVKLEVVGEPEYRKYFKEDKDERYVFKMKLKRNNKSYTFTFGQSINAGGTPPTMYDVLASITKYDVGTIEDFKADFGYDDKGAKYYYPRVKREYEAVEKLFGDILDELRDIS